MAFPSNPNNNDTHRRFGRNYVYRSGKGWTPETLDTATTLTQTSINTFSDIDVVTSTPTDGQLLVWDSDGGKFIPGDTGSGTTTYATANLLPLSGNTAGDQAFVTATNRLYIWNGSGWYNIALINTAPSITSGVNASYEFATDGTPIVITAVGSDPEGVPLTWSYAVTTGSLGNTATVSQADNVFTITPSTNEADAGEFSITFTASDGVNLATAASSFTLSFSLWAAAKSFGSTTPTVVAVVNGQLWTNSYPRGLFVNESIKRIYWVDYGFNYVYQRTYVNDDLSSWTGAAQGYGISSSNGNPSGNIFGISFKDDGTFMYLNDGNGTGNVNIHRYALSTPWDITTATYSSTKALGDSQGFNSDAQGMSISSDGTVLWLVFNNQGTSRWTMSTPWDISTLSYNTQFAPTGQGASWFHPTGNKFFAVNYNSDITEYTATTSFTNSTSYSTNYSVTSAILSNSTMSGLITCCVGTSGNYLYAGGQSSPYTIAKIQLV